MNEEEPRKLDIEVEMTVFGSQWFQVRLVEPGNHGIPQQSEGF